MIVYLLLYKNDIAGVSQSFKPLDWQKVYTPGADSTNMTIGKFGSHTAQPTIANLVLHNRPLANLVPHN